MLLFLGVTLLQWTPQDNLSILWPTMSYNKTTHGSYISLHS